MIEKLTEIENVVDKLETLVRTLREDRDRAWEEVGRLKKALDERETELLQLDEEIRQEAKRFDEQMQSMHQEREDVSNRLDEVAGRIRDLLPLLPKTDIPVYEEPSSILDYSDTEIQ